MAPLTSNPPRFDFPPSAYPILFEALHPKTREVVWTTTNRAARMAGEWGFSGYHLLWEADWTAIPRDPYLLKRIGRDAWVVLADPDDTPNLPDSRHRALTDAGVFPDLICCRCSQAASGGLYPPPRHRPRADAARMLVLRVAVEYRAAALYVSRRREPGCADGAGAVRASR